MMGDGESEAGVTVCRVTEMMGDGESEAGVK